MTTKDSAVFNWDMPGEDNPVDVVEQLRQMMASLEKGAKIEEERMKDPRWRLEPIHVMTPEMWEIVQDPDTPPDIKHRILMATYQGQQWVYSETEGEDGE